MKNKYSVPALEKGILIIEMLSESEQALGITDIYDRCKLPKSTIFMILNTLEQLKYVQKIGENKYTLTLNLYNVAVASLEKLEIRKIARPIMEEIASRHNFTVHLAILENGKAVYVEKVNGPGFVQFSTKIGQMQYLHNSAVGKALAAYIPEHELLKILELHGMPAPTPNTMTSADVFLDFLATVREVGYALEDEEGEHGIRCIAAPIFDYGGNVIASIGITTVRNELPSIKFNEMGTLVRDYALSISEKIGYPQKNQTSLY